MPRRHSKRFAVTRGRSRSSNNGSTTGDFSTSFMPTEPADGRPPSRSGSLKANFKKPGKNGMNNFRGVMITGPPGIGKTSSAHLCAKLAGFTPIELNASDARSKKLVEVRHPDSPSWSSQSTHTTE